MTYNDFQTAEEQAAFEAEAKKITSGSRTQDAKDIWFAARDYFTKPEIFEPISGPKDWYDNHGFNTSDEIQAFDNWRDKSYISEDSKYDLMSKAWQAGRSYAIHKMPDFENEDDNKSLPEKEGPPTSEFAKAEEQRLREMALLFALQSAEAQSTEFVSNRAEKFLSFLRGDAS